MPPMPEEEEGASPLMIMITLVPLALLIFIWWQVITLYSASSVPATSPAVNPLLPTAAPMSSLSAAAKWQQQLESFKQNRTYMTALAAASQFVFLFLVYKTMSLCVKTAARVQRLMPTKTRRPRAARESHLVALPRRARGRPACNSKI